MATLPEELLHKIGLLDSVAYNLLARTSSRFLATCPVRDAKSHFTAPVKRAVLTCYRLPNGHIHSPGDAPAITTHQFWLIPNGHTARFCHDTHFGLEVSFWYKDNMLHRVGGPAVTYSNGQEYYYENDKLLGEVPTMKYPNEYHLIF
jgi:hypothetical protein